MKLFLLSLLVLFTASACSMDGIGIDQKTSTMTGTSSSGSPMVVQPGVAETGRLVTLHYTLREGQRDGKVLETTQESVAKENGTYTATGRYEPFQVMLGSQSVIPGFEAGILGMKKGEKKTIEVLPEVGYGTGPVLQMLPQSRIAPVFTVTQDKKYFEPRVRETLKKSEIGQDLSKAKVGDTLTGANTVAKIIAIDADTVTLEGENKDNPFYGKKVVVGATAESPDGMAKFVIKKISGTGVTVEITNKTSPFYNKKFEPGATLSTPQGTLTIKSIAGDMVEVAQAHPLMGKTLYFDVEVVDIQ